MRRHVGSALLGLALVVSAACSSNGPSTSTEATIGGATATRSLPGRSPLEGEWDTGPYPSGQVRASIIAAGYTKAEGKDASGGGGKRFEFKLVFYEESGVPFVSAAGWDPSKYRDPPDADHGPYRLLPNNQIAITCDVCDLDTQFMLFSYDLSENTLILHFIRSVDPERTSKELHNDVPFMIAWAAAPFQRIRVAG